jgi:hypothetical protein
VTLEVHQIWKLQEVNSCRILAKIVFSRAHAETTLNQLVRREEMKNSVEPLGI